LWIVALIILVGAALAWVLSAPRPMTQAMVPAHQPDLANGALMYNIGGCISCHKPAADAAGMDAAIPSGGAPLKTPIGTFYPPNLTPDPETGLGKWTEAQFVATIRNGKHLGDGRPLLPPMPWPAFRNFSDEDLGAMYAYLKTVPAIRNKVPEPTTPAGPAMPSPPPPPPVNVKTSPGPADAVARGKYLTTAKGCGDCHTPMKMGAQGPEYDMPRMLSGFDARGAVPPMPPVGDAAEVFVVEPAFAGAWGMSFAANLTPDAETGLGTWTEQQFLDTLRNGRHQGRGRQLLPPMPWQMFGQMNDADLKAIFAYLKTVPAVKNKVPEPVAPAPK
jgi:mono/diheme cytochrome c family protein